MNQRTAKSNATSATMDVDDHHSTRTCVDASGCVRSIRTLVTEANKGTVALQEHRFTEAHIIFTATLTHVKHMIEASEQQSNCNQERCQDPCDCDQLKSKMVKMTGLAFNATAGASPDNDQLVQSVIVLVWALQDQDCGRGCTNMAHGQNAAPADDGSVADRCEAVGQLDSSCKTAHLSKIAIAIMFNLALQHHIQALEHHEQQLAFQRQCEQHQQQHSIRPQQVQASDSSSTAQSRGFHDGNTTRSAPRTLCVTSSSPWELSMLVTAINLYRTAYAFTSQQLAKPVDALPRAERRFLDTLVGIMWANLSNINFRLGRHFISQSCLERLLLHMANAASVPTRATDPHAPGAVAGNGNDYSNSSMREGTNEMDISGVGIDVGIAHRQSERSLDSPMAETIERRFVPATHFDASIEPSTANTTEAVSAAVSVATSPPANAARHDRNQDPSLEQEQEQEQADDLRDELWEIITLRLWRHHLAAGAA